MVLLVGGVTPLPSYSVDFLVGEAVEEGDGLLGLLGVGWREAGVACVLVECGDGAGEICLDLDSCGVG